ncbi:nitroreductase family protein [Acanthopleuribacter pedis]|uniref:Nitroreductase family protein n=1 Tax=Acanthopleuribacter pedis TaxID=442870 RepID=A0A8J7U3L7_9BACT|nr:nitroreductase family protein [Acanthopleuribacter pedis]MBO1317391.1 nitroreductase family protein [Acanthopleuribacter pedis]
MSDLRRPNFPIEPLILNRWSPRAFVPQSMPYNDLATMFEAARWAPSAYNQQPWRFHYALRDDANWLSFLDLLDPFNRGWAQHASALVFVFSARSSRGRDDKVRAIPSHSFDTGAACTLFSLQATALGYHAHTVAGLDYEAARQQLAVPQNMAVEVAIAVGRRANPETLPTELQQRERPSTRLPLSERFFAGPFAGEPQTQRELPQ